MNNSVVGFDLGGHQFEGLHTSLVVGFEQVNLGELRAQIVRLSDRFEHLENVIKFFIGLQVSPIEGHIALSTAGKDLDCFLVGYLDSHTLVTEKVEARQLYWINIHLETDSTFHFISKSLVSVLLKCISLTPNWLVLHQDTDW